MSDEQKGSVCLPHISQWEEFTQCLRECDAILAKKGHDYTQGEPGARGRLKNFYRNAEKRRTTPYKVLQTYVAKHWDALETFFEQGQVESEPIEGRIADIVNYMMLLYMMVKYEGRVARGEIEHKPFLPQG